jgi:peptidyl-prolyl cis-trans isomerase SurA
VEPDRMNRVSVLVVLFALGARAEIKERIAGVVNGQPITLSEVEERKGPELARVLQQRPSAQRDKERADLLRRGLDELVDEKLIESEARTLGFDLTEEELQRGLEQLARQNSMEVADFREALEQQGISWDTAREIVRRQQLTGQVLRFKVKPRNVTDAEVQAAYAAMTKEPEVEVHARHIFIATHEGAPAAQLAAGKARAEQAIRRIRAGETFALVAREMSDGPTARQGGDLGYFRRGLMLPAIEQAAFSLKAGEVSGLIKTGSGYHIVMVEDRRAVPPKPLEEMREEIRNRLANDSIMKERENFLSTLRKTAQIDLKL